MKSTLPIVAAVPNYNMGESLRQLVPDLLNGGYDQVCVLDDASTDSSPDVIADFGRDILSVIGQENVGSGANRNRVLRVLARESVIHFVDADMIMETKQSAPIVREWIDRQNVGFTGGLIKNADGSQQLFNYGPRQCLYTDSHYLLLMGIYAAYGNKPELASRLRDRLSRSLGGWPDPYKTPERHRVFWAAEANFAINSEVLEKLGGFDENMRAQEILEFSMRVEKAGLTSWFDPKVETTHQAIQVRTGNRSVSDLSSMAYTIRKHGIRNYLRPEGYFKPAIL